MAMLGLMILVKENKTIPLKNGIQDSCTVILAKAGIQRKRGKGEIYISPPFIPPLRRRRGGQEERSLY
jgi:hypothetical protein